MFKEEVTERIGCLGQVYEHLGLLYLVENILLCFSS